MPGYIPPPNYHPTSPGDAGAVRGYAAKLRAAAKSLQSISDDGDTQVWFYTDGQSWGDQFKTMWSEQITASDQLNASAYAQDRASFVKANPRLARLYDANSDQSPGAFRSLIDACNQMADTLDQYAHSIDQENAQSWDIFLDVVVILASVIVTAVSFGALGPEAALLDIAVVGATIGGFTSMAIDFSNQMVNNIVVNHDGFGTALGNLNMQELQNAFITGYIVGGVSSVIGMGIPMVMSAAGGVFKAAISNTIVRIGVEAVGFGAGTFVGDLGAQQVVSLVDNLRLTAPDWGSAAKDAVFATAGGVVFGTLMHGLGFAGKAPDTAGATDPTAQQWGIGVTTVDENGGKISFFALSDPKGGPDLTLFEGSPTSVAHEIGPARLIDGTTLAANDGSINIDLAKPGTDMLLQTGRSSSWITVDPNGSPRFVAESAISDGSIKFTVTPGDRGVPSDLNFDPNTGEMQVPKDWKVTADYNGGRVTVTSPWSDEASYTFSLRDPGSQGWNGMDPKMIAGPAATGGGDPTGGSGLHPDVTTGDSSPELSVQTMDRPTNVIDGTVVDKPAGPPIDVSTGSGGPQSTGEATGGLRLEPAGVEQAPQPLSVPPDQLGGDPGQKLLGPGPGGSVDPHALSPEEAAQAQRIWNLRQGDIQGVAIRSEPGIDGTREGQFISLKSVQGGLGGVARNVGRAEMQAARIGLRGVDVYVDAPNVGSAELLDFGSQGVIPRIIDNGVVGSLWVQTRDGWVVFPGRVETPPAPPAPIAGPAAGSGGDAPTGGLRVEPASAPRPGDLPGAQPDPRLGAGGQVVPQQDQIVQALRQIEGLKPDVWNTLDPGQRVNVLQGVEDTVAGIQGRPALQVVSDPLPGALGQFDLRTGTIKVNEGALNGSVDQETILATVLHEDRHAYQMFAIKNPGFHPDVQEVDSWRLNFTKENYQYPSADPQQFHRYWTQPIENDARSVMPLAREVLDGIGDPVPLPGSDVSQQPTQPLPDVSQQPTQPLPDVSQHPVQPAHAPADDAAELAKARAALLHALQQHGLDLTDPRVPAFRAQGREMLTVDSHGDITVNELPGRMRQGVSIHVGFDVARARFWLTDMGRGTVVEFQVRQSFLDRLRAEAEPESTPNRSRLNPWRVDLHTRGQVWADQYAIPPSWFDDLRASIVPGSARVWRLSDLQDVGGPLQPGSAPGGAGGGTPTTPTAPTAPAPTNPTGGAASGDDPASPMSAQPPSSGPAPAGPTELALQGRGIESVQPFPEWPASRQVSLVTFSDGGQGILKVLPLRQLVHDQAFFRMSERFGFDLVPPTVLRSVEPFGLAKLQVMVEGGPGRWPTDYSVPEQQMSAVLDYVGGHQDRHLGNLKTWSDGHVALTDNKATFPRWKGLATGSEFVKVWINQPLSPEVVAAVRAVPPHEFHAMLVGTGVEEGEADLATARLQEIAQHGMITGQADVEGQRPPVARALSVDQPAVGQPAVGQSVAHQDQIVQALQQIDGLRPDVWDGMNTGQRVDVLQRVENTVASIQGRPSMQVEATALPPGTAGRYDPATGAIQVSAAALEAPDGELGALETVLHDGRHAYQDFAIANPGFHADAGQVAAWDRNWQTGRYEEPSTSSPAQHLRYEAQPLETDARSFEPIARQVLNGIEAGGERPLSGPPARAEAPPPSPVSGRPAVARALPPGVDPSAVEPTGALAPAAAVVREQLSGPAAATARGLLDRVMEADAAIRELGAGSDPAAREAAVRALQSLGSSIDDASRALDLFDVAQARLRAEVDLARSLPPEQRPAGLAEAEALVANDSARDAMQSAVDSARGVHDAGRMRLEVRPMTPEEIRAQGRLEVTEAASETLRTSQVELREQLLVEERVRLSAAPPEERALIRTQYAEARRLLTRQQELETAGLRILTYITEWDPYLGGVPMVNRSLSIGLAEAGHEVFARVGREMPEGEMDSGVHLIGTPSFDPNVDPREQLLYQGETLPGEVDVVIGHSRFSGLAARLVRNERFPDAKLVHFVHMVTAALGRVQGRPEFGLRNEAIESDLVAGSDLAVGVGPALAEEVGRLAAMTGSTPGIHELIPGVPFETPVPPAGDHQPTILLFGRADDSAKGAGAAALMLRDLPPDVRLIVRGAPPETVAQATAELSEIAGRFVEVRPRTIDRAQLLGDMREADVVIMPSRSEGFGLVGIEAAGAGVPILVPSTSGVGRFVGDSKLFAPEIGRATLVEQSYEEPVPVERWVARLREILDDPAKARRIALDLRQALLEQNRTWRGAAESLVAAIRALDTRQVPLPPPAEEEPRSGGAAR